MASLVDVDTRELPDGRVAQLWSGGAKGPGPVVLFFHGCPDTRWAARSGAEAARRSGVRLVCVNRPGYGRSSPAASTHASVADDASAVLDHLGVGAVAVLGMSVGGAYAAAFAARHADRVQGLGVVGTLPMPAAGDPPGSTVAEAMAAFRPEFEAWAASMDVTDPDDQAVAARWIASLPDQDAALVGARPAHEVAASAREALASYDGYLRDAALTFRPWDVDVSAVRCPTWLWYGGADERALPGADWFAAQIAHATVTVRPGVTHWATLAAHWEDILTTLTSGGRAARSRLGSTPESG
jgi:pimeloyl-ACP methyl ester carboxylesterase